MNVRQGKFPTTVEYSNQWKQDNCATKTVPKEVPYPYMLIGGITQYKCLWISGLKAL